MGERKEKVIRELIEYIPSKDLREYYKNLVADNQIPVFTDKELYTMALKFIGKNNIKECFKYIIRIKMFTEDNGLLSSIKVQEEIYKKEKFLKLYDKYRDYKIETLSFVNYKTLFKHGDIIKCLVNGEVLYGIVDSHNYDKKKEFIDNREVRYKHNVYKCVLLDDYGNKCIKMFLAHKDNTEKCEISDLPKKQKTALYKYLSDKEKVRCLKLLEVDKYNIIKQIDVYDFIDWWLEITNEKFEKHKSTFSSGYIQYLVSELSDIIYKNKGLKEVANSELYDIVIKYLNDNFVLYGIYPKGDRRNKCIFKDYYYEKEQEK